MTTAFRRSLLMTVLAVASVAMLIPVYYMIVVAAGDPGRNIPSVWFQGFSLFSNIREVLGQQEFPRYFVNSFIMAGGIAISDVIFSGLAGYALAKLTFPGRSVLFALVVGTLSLSPIVVLIPVYILMRDVHWLNSYQGLIVPFAVSAFGVFLVRQFALGIPDQLIHSARIEGASEVRIYFLIAMPLLRPALLTLFLLQFVAQWDNLLWPLVVASKQSLWTVPVGLSSFQTEQGVAYQLVMAGAVLSVIPPMVLFAFLQRYYVRGLTLGSLKG